MQRRQFLQAIPATLWATAAAARGSFPALANGDSICPPECRWWIEAHEGPVTGAVFLDRHHLASWSSDGTLRLWDVRDGAAGPVLRHHRRGLRHVAFPGGGKVVTWDTQDRTVRQWRLRDGAREWAVDPNLRDPKGMAVLGPGQFLVWGSNGLALIGPGGVRRLFDGRRETPWGANLKGVNPWLQGVQLLSDGRVLSWSNRGGMRLWDGQNGDPGPVLATRGVAKAVALPGNRLLTWGREGFRFWDTARLEPGPLISSDIGWLRGALPLSDGAVAVWDYDGHIRILTGGIGEAQSRPEGHGQAVQGMRELPNGRLFSWSAERALRIWDRARGQTAAILTGHTDRIQGAELLPDGKILSGSRDGTFRCWDGARGRCTGTAQVHPEGARLIRRQGRMLLSGSRTGELAVWKV